MAQGQGPQCLFMKGRQERAAIACEPEPLRDSEAYGLQRSWESFVARQTKLIFHGNISGNSRIQYV